MNQPNDQGFSAREVRLENHTETMNSVSHGEEVGPGGYPPQEKWDQGGPVGEAPGQYNYSAPFAESPATMPKTPAGGGKAALWAVLVAVGAVLMIGVVFVVYQSLQDPFRTLDTFPTQRYLDNYEGVVGSRFRASLTVDAELGGTFDMGRLLTFREEVTQKPLAVLVPPNLAQTGFSKGQSYVAEVEVGQGGLIHAHGFKKN